jgi:hypothetical protein
MKKRKFSKDFRDSCLIVAEQVYGRKGTWAYEAFTFINDAYFAGRIPWPHILWGLTAHGGCVAWASTARDKSRPPIITLHPSLLRGRERENPWEIPPDWLGASLAFDTLLHECIHVHIDYNLGGHDGRSSHDCKRWVRQVNRLAPLLGFKGVRFGGTKLKRVPIPGAPLTPRGKRPTKVVRINLGNVPFRVAAGFPKSLRCHLGQAHEHYGNNRLPPSLPTFSES